MIGIIGAVVQEAEAIKEEMENIKEEKIYNFSFFTGTYNDKEVVFVEAGIGKVNAAISTTLLIERFKVDKIIFCGVAGSVDEKISVGNVVIGTDVVQHDVDATEFGYIKGQIPQMDVYSFKCEESLIERVKNSNIDNIKLFYGRILTGDQFITGKEIKVKMGVDFKGMCVDMESGSVAQVCHRLNVPFLIVRSISDSISDDSGIEYNEFVKLAAKNSKTILNKIV